MFNLFSAIQRQQRGLPGPSPEVCQDHATQANLAANQFHRYAFKVPDGVVAFARASDLVTVLDRRGRLSLYQLSTRKNIWSLSVDAVCPLDNFTCFQVRLSAEGVVLLIHTPPDPADRMLDDIYFDEDAAHDTAIDELFANAEVTTAPEEMIDDLDEESVNEFDADDRNHTICIFKNNRHQGTILLPVITTRLDLFHVVGDRLFGIVDNAVFCEWNLQGAVMRRLDVGTDLSTATVSLACSDSYYVLVHPAKDYLAQCFIFSLARNQMAVLPVAGEGLSVDAIAIEDDRLVIATSGWNESSAKTRIPIAPALHYLNLGSARREGEVIHVMHPDDSARVKRLWIGHDRIFCLLLVDFMFYDLYFIDKASQVSQRLLRVKDEDLRSEEAMQVSWSGQLVSVCYLNCEYLLRKCIFDLRHLPDLAGEEKIPSCPESLKPVSGNAYPLGDVFLRSRLLDKFSLAADHFIIVRANDFVVMDYRWFAMRKKVEKQIDAEEKIQNNHEAKENNPSPALGRG